MPYPMAAARGHVFSQGTGAAPAWWDLSGATIVAAYQPIGADDLADSYINLANPGTNDAAPGVAPTWASGDGWTFNGGTQYLTTGYIPVPAYSILVRFSDRGVSGRYLFGFNNGGPPEYSFVSLAATRNSYRHGGSANTDPTMTGGVLGFGGRYGYRDGVVDTPQLVVLSGTLIQIYLGGFNNGGVLGAPLDGKIQAVAIYSTTLDATQVANLTTAMNALTG